MKFLLASLILFLGMYAFAEQDELEALLNQSTCDIRDAKGQPIPARCDGFAQKPKTKELDLKVSTAPSDDDLDIE